LPATKEQYKVIAV